MSGVARRSWSSGPTYCSSSERPQGTGRGLTASSRLELNRPMRSSSTPVLCPSAGPKIPERCTEPGARPVAVDGQRRLGIRVPHDGLPRGRTSPPSSALGLSMTSCRPCRATGRSVHRLRPPLATAEADRKSSFAQDAKKIRAMPPGAPDQGRTEDRLGRWHARSDLRDSSCVGAELVEIERSRTHTVAWRPARVSRSSGLPFSARLRRTGQKGAQALPRMRDSQPVFTTRRTSSWPSRCPVLATARCLP